MTKSPGHKSKKKWYITAGTVVAVLLAFLANMDGTINFFDRLLGADEPTVTGSAGGSETSTTPTLSETTSASTTAPTTVEDSQSTSVSTSTHRGSTDSQATPRTTAGWFDLTAYRPVAFGNGHDSVNSINIGTGVDPYPNSIQGYYSSSASDPNNRRTWQVGGHCTRFSAWVGKDASSSHTAGTGRFIIKAEDIEIHSAEATITDAPVPIELDITGIIRLTLLDTRTGQDANNAWGTPRVYCTAPPGEAR